MEMYDEDKSNDDIQEPSLEDKFSKLFYELEHCNEDVQRKIIEETNGIVEEMNEEEFELVFTKDLYDKMNKMIEEKKVSMENTILLLKHVGYCDVLKNVWNPFVEESSLSKRFEQMIIDKNEKKKEGKNKKLLANLSECYLLLNRWASSEVILICMHCVLKVAMNKEESEEAQKEVEMALLALSNIAMWKIIEEKLFLKEIKEIIQYHQKCGNLTRLAYQSAWRFLVSRLWDDNSLEKVIVVEQHFAREAARELEELSKTTGNKAVKVEDLLKGKAIDVALEEIHKSAKDDEITAKILKFFLNVSRRLEKTDDEADEVERKETKRKISEKMEEEGYEDAIISFCEIFDFLNDLYFFSGKLSLNASDYFVNV
ncbi:uncharacterized protein MONOS_15428 [Monocercomonoides exilis]|uniref:uncharacterized protein n=1 Tax=Monocercomonoides exilis TaxID=2049356 RepID=UPI00355A0CCC|nr:hypothetical protein MONOS_15428 [Monocercomonoides exilis]|eukprot:MONOS_15428.1-p1 / transcript=MONOS_15428.1 / gene=MONOS_15428 / organism=Monocercomonoides_exilis_PA203 / gene_product=unspecified product / transcript_product=unspecified product / location=Mono_scaffold01229:10687-12144(-) / protein_length=371 / sequence_SO=supercontig / SO=protein_coding / is_pseudo=false